MAVVIAAMFCLVITAPTMLLRSHPTQQKIEQLEAEREQIEVRQTEIMRDLDIAERQRELLERQQVLMLRHLDAMEPNP